MVRKRRADSSSRGKSRAVAILVDTSTSWGRRVIEGAAQFAHQHTDWRLYLEARGMEETLRLPSGWKGDGVIARVSSDEMARELKSAGFPVVNVSGIRASGADFPRVTTDMKAVASLAIEHFLDRGFQSFAYFSLKGLAYVAPQRDAFLMAARSRKLGCAVFELNPQFGAEADWTTDNGLILGWLRTLPKPVAILAWNASCARAIIHAAQRGGLLVPEEIAVLSGADDDLLCEHIQPPVSGVVVDARKIGYHAAAGLKQLMEGGKKPRREMPLPPLAIHARQSTDTLAINDAELVKALSFIRKNAASPIQVGDVAAASGLSRRVLERRFAEKLGRSPAAEIRRCHVERAKKLLQETRQPIPRVAESAGFCSPEHFSTYFRSAVGKTPLRFRKDTMPSGY
ncbi:MAG: DNA-binding transcriptional regulator [Opitutaceae bacterium]|jgi:LacI family transcriptional regulator|nr:DNA-binding transcriptional regulator [Opitutaceae bacterium]